MENLMKLYYESQATQKEIWNLLSGTVANGRRMMLDGHCNGIKDEDFTEAVARKQRPLCSGVLDYFPQALMEVAYASYMGNEQHHAGATLHWDKSKSTDEADALLRHLAERGTLDTDGVRHSAKVAWRALAMLQRELDGET